MQSKIFVINLGIQRYYNAFVFFCQGKTRASATNSGYCMTLPLFLKKYADFVKNIFKKVLTTRFPCAIISTL
jgi:hypothetical protein